MKDDVRHVIAVYNPALLRREELKRCFVARQELLQHILADLKRCDPSHRLLLGMHGMGKTTLLRRIAVAVEEDDTLRNEWQALTFPEEQYNIASLAGLWRNCLYALCHALEQCGEENAARHLYDKIAFLRKNDSFASLQLLLEEAESRKKRLLLLVDNIDLILNRFKEERRQFFDILQSERRILVIGAGVTTCKSDGDTFADIFAVNELKGLTLQEMLDSLRNLATINHAPLIGALLDSDPARIKALHILTGGNPRTIALLYGVLAQNPEAGNILSDLDALLDYVTPQYQARIETLPAQAQQLVDALAMHWDPVTAHQLAEMLDWQVNQVSAQLSRLEQQGVIEKQPPASGKRVAFQLVDRFFNIWYLMRSGRGSRRKLMWLARFLRIFYHAGELHKFAGQCLGKPIRHQHEAEYSFALSRAVDDPGLRIALENQALSALLKLQETHDKILELLDVDIKDTELLPRLKRMMHLREIRQLCDVALAVQDTDINKRYCGDLLSGSLALSLEEKAVISRLSATLSSEQWQKLKAILNNEYSQHLQVFGPSIGDFYRAVAAGEINGGSDLQGAQAAAIHYGQPELLAIAAFFTTAYDSRPASVTPEKLEEAYRALLQKHPSAALWNSFGDFLQLVPQRFDAAEDAYRQALALDADNADYANNLACLLLRCRKNLPEALSLAERAVQLDADNFRALHTLLALLLHTRRWPEFDKHLRRYLEGGSDDFHQSFWKDTLLLCKEALQQDKYRAQHLLAILDSGEAGQRWRPLREALMVIAGGNPLYLNAVAPEVRGSAENILRLLLEG